MDREKRKKAGRQEGKLKQTSQKAINVILL